MFQTERFPKVVNNLKLFTIFAEHFIFNNCWSFEYNSTHCNLSVFYGYLFLLFLLYLYIVVISCWFKLTTITSVQHSTEPCAEVVVLTLRGKDRPVYLFYYCWPFSGQCSCCVETIQLICVTNQVTGCYVNLVLAWKRLSIYLYYIVTINMLSFNRRLRGYYKQQTV